MVLEKLLAEGNTKDFLRGLGRGYLDIPNECSLINLPYSEPRTLREYQGRKLGKLCFISTCGLALYVGLSP